MGVEDLRWVVRAFGGCGGQAMGEKGFGSGGPEMGVKGIRWLWRGLRWVIRALGGCGGPGMGRKGIIWVWRA